jgi:hypothetical protein
MGMPTPGEGSAGAMDSDSGASGGCLVSSFTRDSSVQDVGAQLGPVGICYRTLVTANYGSGQYCCQQKIYRIEMGAAGEICTRWEEARWYEKCLERESEEAQSEQIVVLLQQVKVGWRTAGARRRPDGELDHRTRRRALAKGIRQPKGGPKIAG